MDKKIIFIFIKVYQKIFSPDRGLFNFLFPIGSCRFYPSCSCYTKEAIEKYGSLKGLFLGIKRIMRCNPLSRGGVDLLK